MTDVDIRDLTGPELALAGGVAARALLDYPLKVAVFGDDRLERAKVSYEIFTAQLPTLDVPPLGACVGSCVIGVWAVAPPGACARHRFPEASLTPPARTVGPPGDATRMQYWLATWAEHDLPDRHWHVGPVGVEPGLQGLGVGRRPMEAFNARMDSHREIAFLETDKLENVRFYSGGGFEVVEEIDMLGAPNWFMRRDPC